MSPNIVVVSTFGLGWIDRSRDHSKRRSVVFVRVLCVTDFLIPSRLLVTTPKGLVSLK